MVGVEYLKPTLNITAERLTCRASSNLDLLQRCQAYWPQRWRYCG